jgi:IS6 family transposase
MRAMVSLISAVVRNVAELVAERGVEVDASCMGRWVQAYAPELSKRCRPYLKPTNKSYRIDDVYKGERRGQISVSSARFHRANVFCARPLRHRAIPCRGLIEQDHWTVKKRVWLAKGYRSLQSAWRTLQGIETVHMIRKGRVGWLAKGNAAFQAYFIAELFSLAA